MNEQFEKHKWIFEPDGSLLDIYVQETTIDDWNILIDFLNANYKVEYGPTSENESGDGIYKDDVLDYLLDTTGKIEGKSASIFKDNLVFNCHFFLKDEIEFDVNPKEFKGQGDFDTLITFMSAVSKALNKEILLTPENRPLYPLITIDITRDQLSFLSQHQLKYLHDKSITLKGKLRGFYIRKLMQLLPKLKNSKFKDWLVNHIIEMTGANKPHVATKKRVSVNHKTEHNK